MTDSIDRTSDRPVYQQIADELREGILEGTFAAGSPLPSERELMDKYDASRGTVRQSVAVLKAEGLVSIEQGRGAFARRSPPIRRLGHDRFARRYRDAGKAAFLAELESEGREPDVQVLEIAPTASSSDIAKRLGMRAGTKVLVRRRRYLADGQPVELATSYLPWQLVKGTPICDENPGPGGIYARLEELGHRLKHFTEEVTARMPLPDEARELRMRSGVPLLHLVRTAYDSEDRAVEVCDTLMVSESYVLSYELPAT